VLRDHLSLLLLLLDFLLLFGHGGKLLLKECSKKRMLKDLASFENSSGEFEDLLSQTKLPLNDVPMRNHPISRAGAQKAKIKPGTQRSHQ